MGRLKCPDGHDFLDRDSGLKATARFGVALFFIAVGVHHFVDPTPYLAIMPPYLPWHLTLVYVSGFFEVLGGMGLLLPTQRRRAAYGLIALLVAVYPANIHMLINNVYLPDMPQERWILWLRMPLQLVLAMGVLWVGNIWPKSTTQATDSSSDPP